jgi:predicted ATPase/DNA-binding CsgD family transcriptional regulator
VASWLVRSGCTTAAACGYGTGVGVSAAETAAGGVHGFPAALTSFIGRDGPVREVAGLLAEQRLVTVTGPGGVGKTRLAGQVARAVASGFADGAWLAELAPVGEAAQVPGVVAAALGVREQPGVPVAKAVARVLARQQLLLVLDNCEHVIGAAAELCAGLLAACDDVRVLATSREPLAVAGEARYRLGPLSVPGTGTSDPGGSEAVALFADRARQADAQFALTGETGPGVARLVARLDGMPLAIELAAARVEALRVTQLLDRLDDRFALLTAGDRLAPSRHRSLEATVEWSYRLLAEPEQRVFRLVSVFPGPFTLEAAEAVAGQAAGPAVLHLVDCSLLVPPRAGPDGRSRYAMLETLRAYGAGLLAGSGEQDAAAAALAGWAVEVAGQAAAGLHTIDGEAAAARWLDAEDATIRQVLAWAMDRDMPAALRLVAALGRWWSVRGRLVSQYRLLCEVTGRAVPGSDGWCAAQALLAAAALAAGDTAAALDHATALRDAAAEQGPSPALAQALAGRSAALSHMGRYAEAAEDARRLLAVGPGGRVSARGGTRPGRSRRGRLLCRRLRRRRPAGPAGLPDHRRGSRVGGPVVQLLPRRCPDRGRRPGRRRARLRGDTGPGTGCGDVASQVNLLPQMATLDLQAGRLQDAAAYLRESLQLTTRTSIWAALSVDLDRCGLLCAATGRPAEAVTVWAAMAALLRHQESADWPVDARRRAEPLRRAREALGPARTRVAEQRGAAMSVDTAVEYALMLTDTGPPQPAQGPERLSVRERELVTLVAQGRTDAQIAEQLYISIRTVRSHLDRIRDKTGCRRRADLTRLALAAGLV